MAGIWLFALVNNASSNKLNGQLATSCMLHRQYWFEQRFQMAGWPAHDLSLEAAQPAVTKHSVS